MSTTEAANYLRAQSILDGRTLNAWHGYAVQHLADGRVIGDLGIWLPSAPENAPDIGFQFHPAYHGRGYAREAVEAFLTHTFTTLTPPRVTATCASANMASQALMKRLGMRLVEATPEDIQYDVTRVQWLTHVAAQ